MLIQRFFANLVGGEDGEKFCAERSELQSVVFRAQLLQVPPQVLVQGVVEQGAGSWGERSREQEGREQGAGRKRARSREEGSREQGGVGDKRGFNQKEVVI